MSLGQFVGLLALIGMFSMIAYLVGYDNGRKGKRKFPWGKPPKRLEGP